ncbi:hypothetical protein BABINDRAFT_160496 [Babjeviella inositovora NRRL Y-12698]|uniref:Ribosomal protein S15 n=1 Tax=Babjeviella inositovora NRRL Y-12698 TaxID=984486 RepID=A0A1E3QTR6_9ASCO|nr:uncharacterized protein BABINDRAFT_160496 [Babjeviella inositovora NRRL Y-12698]ODQ81085.1 hypothetical protein BABINDRAFT_160496 [Babjeviella inositovora NRRL Y-12698]
MLRASMNTVAMPLQLTFKRTFIPPVMTKAQKATKSFRKAQLNKLRQLALDEHSKKTIDPILGTPNNEFTNRIKAELQEEHVLSKGFEISNVEKLLFGAAKAKLDKTDDGLAPEIFAKEANKRESILRILHMQNANAADQKKLAIQLARAEFQRFDGDTGSPEVQAAIMTIKIQYMVSHIQHAHKDKYTLRRLRMLVQARQTILRYLKTDNPERYYWAINKLGLNDQVVHMEFNMDKKYMQEFKLIGDRVLVKESNNQQEKNRTIKKKLEQFVHMDQAHEEGRDARARKHLKEVNAFHKKVANRKDKDAWKAAKKAEYRAGVEAMIKAKVIEEAEAAKPRA